MPGIGSNNPALRLYSYDRSTAKLMDYWQYYLNLTLTNSIGKPLWTLEYSFAEAYAVIELAPSCIQAVIESFGIVESETFKLYNLYNSVSADTNKSCVGDCLLGHLCSMTEIESARYNACIINGIVKKLPQLQVLMEKNRYVHFENYFREIPKWPSFFPSYFGHVIIFTSTFIVFALVYLLVLPPLVRKHILLKKYSRIIDI